MDKIEKQYFALQYSLMLTTHSYRKYFLGNNFKSFSEIKNQWTAESLAQQRAKRYLQKLQVDYRLYMPLQRIYKVADLADNNSMTMCVVRLAKKIAHRVIEL